MANLSSKELSAIEDQLKAEQVLVQKYQAFSAQFTDPQLRTKCEQIAAKHQNHYQSLLRHLG